MLVMILLVKRSSSMFSFGLVLLDAVADYLAGQAMLTEEILLASVTSTTVSFLLISMALLLMLDE